MTSIEIMTDLTKMINDVLIIANALLYLYKRFCVAIKTSDFDNANSESKFTDENDHIKSINIDIAINQIDLSIWADFTQSIKDCLYKE